MLPGEASGSYQDSVDNGKRFLSYPTDKSYKRWKNFLYFFFVPIISVITPVQMAFRLDETLFSLVNYMTTAMYAADIIINFNTAFYLPNGTLEQNRLQIAKNYVLSGWLIVDFVCCFSFQSWN